ncbi:RagB/SusD family nutrient uptake outer membrane protein [Niastella caeni]|uniref:RagB/SusD family nutrient uptake outer membrane protein n=1 Tax=Niastella caeni TaxID=2569763 RepID=A0A4V4GZV5_9BACT|nr:RagB/SusD family nutrient uptake outer membrane protein [Niastella caeni]THU34126.1 RagB/SusD family nutrient uptake outer membrane protein [Niastella caeni]
MKKRLSIVLIAIAGLSVTACKKDFLNTSSPSEFTPDLVFSSTAYTDFAITGTYALLTQDQLYSARLPLNYATNSDIEVAGADNASYKENSTRGLSNYLGTADNTSLSREWTTIYKLIERANLCVDGIRKSGLMKTSDSSTMKAFLGEAITLRSLAYFELVKNWGDVPYKAEPTKYDLSNVYLAPTDRDLIYDYLLTDLQEAENYVPWVGSGGTYATVERVTKGFIKGLIARIALFRGGYSLRNRNGNAVTERGSDWQKYYTLARTKCQEIMTQGVHKLNSSYIDIWKKLCSLQMDATYQENLFEVANGLGRSGEMGYSIGIRFYTNSKYGFGNNANVVNTTAWYFYMFDQQDLRRDATVAYYTYSNGSADVKEVFQTNPMSFNFAKWDQRFMGSNWSALNKAASGKFGYGINWSVMRYADVLLMFAETENALNGPTTLAKDALKQVRSRAFADADKATKVESYVNALTDQTSFFNAIVNERAYEFGGEAIRKYDLIRWNLLVSKIQEQRDGFKKMLAGTAPYNTLPTYLFYKYQSDNEILDKSGINFYVDKGTADIAGYTKVAWLAGLSAANKTLYSERVDLFSSGLTSGGVQNRHLYPYASSSIAESQGTLVNAYGF